MQEVSLQYSLSGPPGPVSKINNREFDYYCGTGYFALHGHSDLIKAACDATHIYGLGSGTSRASFGNHSILLDVEAKAAKFFESEAAHYYASGYLGSGILLQGLAPDYDVIFMDDDAHYSVQDGAAMARKPVVCFSHRSPEDLRNKLRKKLKADQRPLIISDGIFPVSGELVPLDEYHQILLDFDHALLCVDDAHATGVIGKKGHGTLEYFGLQGAGYYSSGTLSKALGGFGGIIAGSKELIERVTFNGASSAPAGAAAAAIELLMARPKIRHRLW